MPFSDYIDNIQHAERRDLYTSFPKRMAFLQAFINFTKDDIVVFNQGAKYLRAAIPSLTHRLYEKMLEFDITARALRTRNTASNALVDDYFTIDSPHVQRRKIFWKWYLTRLCSDPSQLGYWEYLEKVGAMHTGKILIHPLTIEYIHMNACLGYLKELLLETISLHPDMSSAFKFSLIRSLSKILCIQNDLIAKCYIGEGGELSTESLAAHDLAKTESIKGETGDVSDTGDPVPITEQRSTLHLPIVSASHFKPTPEGVATVSNGNLAVENAVPKSNAFTDKESIPRNSPGTPGHPRAIPVFSSPFTVDNLQTFETKAWFAARKEEDTGS